MKNPYSSTLNVQAISRSVLSFSSVHRSNTQPANNGSGTGICQLNSNFFVIFPHHKSKRMLQNNLSTNIENVLDKPENKSFVENLSKPNKLDISLNLTACFSNWMVKPKISVSKIEKTFQILNYFNWIFIRKKKSLKKRKECGGNFRNAKKLLTRKKRTLKSLLHRSKYECQMNVKSLN